jgi:hypothetical protein
MIYLTPVIKRLKHKIQTQKMSTKYVLGTNKLYAWVYSLTQFAVVSKIVFYYTSSDMFRPINNGYLVYEYNGNVLLECKDH